MNHFISFSILFFFLAISTEAQISNSKISTKTTTLDPAKPASMKTQPVNTYNRNTAGSATNSTALPSQTFIASPQLVRSFNWWMSINPADCGIDYRYPPMRQSFYDSAMEKYSQKTKISFGGWNYMAGRQYMTADSMINLLAIPGMTEVIITKPVLDNKALYYLGQLPNLKSVIYYGYIAEPRLETDNPINDQGIHDLTRNRNLEGVSINCCTRVTDAGFANFKNMSKLNYLAVSFWTGITDNAMLSLEGCSNLETLALNGTNITITGLNNLKSIMQTMPRLRTIIYNSASMSRDDFFAFINSCKAAGFNVSGIW